jgi:hypothetical protein
VPQRTHRANHNDSPRPEGENRIVRKCMAELGISGEAMAGAGKPMPSTTGEAGFGEKEFGSSGRTRTYNPSVNSHPAGLVLAALESTKTCRRIAPL